MVHPACRWVGSVCPARAPRQINDFVGLKKQYPTLRRVCFNGKTAAKIQHYFQSQGYQTLVLPSSSPANAMLSMEQKCALWRQLVQELQLQMITNRGTKVWPNGFPETFCTDHWRCRFKKSDESFIENYDKAISLSGKLNEAGLEIIKTENLYYFDGEPGFTAAQGQ